jgi:hypothetical protein
VIPAFDTAGRTGEDDFRHVLVLGWRGTAAGQRPLSELKWGALDGHGRRA